MSTQDRSTFSALLGTMVSAIQDNGEPLQAPTADHIQGANNRRHNQEFSIEDMRQVLDWSQNQVSSQGIANATQRPPQDSVTRALILKHVRLRALLKLGFVLWPR
ncbi:hypothetical protein DXG01_001552, partial [Tephrocybe rancida]